MIEDMNNKQRAAVTFYLLKIISRYVNSMSFFNDVAYLNIFNFSRSNNVDKKVWMMDDFQFYFLNCKKRR